MVEQTFDFNLETASSGEFPRFHKKLTGYGKYIRQTNCLGGYGVISIEVYPSVESYDIHLIWRVDEETIPSVFIEDVIQGIKAWFSKKGKLKQSLRIYVVGGMYHLIDSNNKSYFEATKMALDDAFKDICDLSQKQL